MANYRMRLEYDDTPDYLFLEQFNSPEKYQGNEIYDDGEPLPFDKYIRTWGDPDNYVIFGAIWEKQCECCGTWVTKGSIWNVDYYIPSGEYPKPGTYSLEQVKADKNLAWVYEDYFKEETDA